MLKVLGLENKSNIDIEILTLISYYFLGNIYTFFLENISYKITIFIGY